MFKHGQRNPETEKRWRKIVAEQESSGLTQSEFCRRRGIKLSTFNHWKIEIRIRDQERKLSPKKAITKQTVHPSPSIFIPVVPKDSECTSDKKAKVMEIVFAGGKYSLRLDMDIDRESLRKIVTALVDIKC